MEIRGGTLIEWLVVGGREKRLKMPCTWLKHLGTVFLPLTIRSHEAADLIGASTHRAGRSF